MGLSPLQAGLYCCVVENFSNSNSIKSNDCLLRGVHLYTHPDSQIKSGISVTRPRACCRGATNGRVMCCMLRLV